jgi:hypothetical protein
MQYGIRFSIQRFPTKQSLQNKRIGLTRSGMISLYIHLPKFFLFSVRPKQLINVELNSSSLSFRPICTSLLAQNS